MGRTGVVAHDPSAPSGHLPALCAGRNENGIRFLSGPPQNTFVTEKNARPSHSRVLPQPTGEMSVSV